MTTEPTIGATRLGAVTFDDAALARDIETIESFEFDAAYKDYAVGEWSSCSLYNRDGDKNDGLSYEYEGRAAITEYGRQVPYIDKVINSVFRMERCKSVRVFAIRGLGLVIPHRDYLEFKRGFSRLHLVLQTNPRCFNSEGRVVFTMQRGEIWFVDGTPVHSAANFSTAARYHLILDFDPAYALSDLLRDPDGVVAKHEIAFLRREPMGEPARRALDALAKLVDRQNFPDVLALLSKLHFSHDASAAATFDWLREIAIRSESAEVQALADEACQKYIGEPLTRSEGHDAHG
jgi:hypothetical protein